MSSDLVIASVGFVVMILVGIGIFFSLVDRFYEPSPIHEANQEPDRND